MYTPDYAYQFAHEVQAMSRYVDVPPVEDIVAYTDRLFGFTSEAGRQNNYAYMHMALSCMLRCDDAKVVVRHDEGNKSTLVPRDVGLTYPGRGAIVFREVHVNLADSGTLPFLNNSDGDARACFELRLHPRRGKRPLAEIGFRHVSENRSINHIPHFRGVRPLLEACAEGFGIDVGILQDRLLSRVCLYRKETMWHGMPCAELGIPCEMMSLRFNHFHLGTPDEVWKPYTLQIDSRRAPEWYAFLHEPLMLGSIADVSADGPFDSIEGAAVPPDRSSQPLLTYEHEDNPESF